MAAGRAVEVVAEAAEIVSEESAQVAEATREINPRDASIIMGVFVIGVSVGATSGYLFLKKRLQLKYNQIADEEIAGMKEHYDSKLRALDNKSEKETLDEVVKDMKYATEGKDGGGKVPYHLVGSDPDKALADDMEQEAADEADPNVTNIFVNNSGEHIQVETTDGWDYDEEVKTRTPEVPYVIHRDEHQEGAPGDAEYEQFTLTYFEGDDILCRDDDTVIEDQDEIVGLGNLAKFGHGSGDPNIVYIRNDKLQVDLEVVHSNGTYAMEVHGLPPEDSLKHSSMRRRSPRRSEYDPDR